MKRFVYPQPSNMVFVGGGEFGVPAIPVGGYPAIVVTRGLEETWDTQYTAGHNPATLTKTLGVTSLPAGVTFDGTFLIVSGNDVTLDNWNLNACRGVEVSGDRCTITNCVLDIGDNTEAGAFYAVEITATAQDFVANFLTIDDTNMRQGANILIVRAGGTATFNDCRFIGAEIKQIGGVLTLNRCYQKPSTNWYDDHLDLAQPAGGEIEFFKCMYDCRDWDGYGDVLDPSTRDIISITDTGADRVRLTFSSNIPAWWIANGERGLQIQGVGGATQLNANGIDQGSFWRIQAVTANTVDLCKLADVAGIALLGINFSSLSAYTGGGTAQISPVPMTNYLRLEGAVGITSAIVSQCICVGFAGVPGSYNPMAVDETIENVSFTNNLWDAGVNGSFFDLTTPGAIIEWTDNYDFDTGNAIPEPTV